MSLQHQQPPSPLSEQTLQDCIINLQSRIAEHRIRHLRLVSAIASANNGQRPLTPQEREWLRDIQDRYLEASNAVMQEGQMLMEKLAESMERMNGLVEDIVGST